MTSLQNKILITAFDFYPNSGGVATYAWELADSLSQQGFEVRVLAKKRGDLPPLPTSFAIEYVDLPDSGLVAYPLMTRHLLRLLLTWRPQRIIATLWMPGAVAAITARLLARSRVQIYTVVHAMEVIESGSTLKKWLRARLQFLKKWTFRKVNKVFCVSHYTRDLVLNETHCSADKVFVINNGVNAKKFKPTNIPHYTSERWEKSYPILLTVARLMPHKGIDVMLKALPLIRKKHPEVHYIIGGKGPDEKRLRALVQELELENQVSFIGYIEEPYLPVYYSLADLFVLLSREERPFVEGFGLVFLEAAACGTPAIGGRSGGIPDAIIDGQTGWLVDPRDPVAVSTKVLEIFSHPEIAERMGQQALDYTLKNRQWQHVSETMLKLMEAHDT